MSVSKVDIYNLALQKLGAGRVSAIDEDAPNQRSCTACYAFMLDAELRSRAWVFSIKRVALAASTTSPAFGNLSAYPLPSDCLRPLFNGNTFIDWMIESIDDAPAILTADGAPLNLRYISRVTDPNRFDINFVQMLACRMALQMCEEITQSSSKKQDIGAEYTLIRNVARQMNAYEILPQEGPEDTWLAARRQGLTAAPWLRRQNG